jgi:hypothetical protein
VHIIWVHHSPRRIGVHERNQHFLRSAHRALNNSAALLDREAETAASRVSVTKDLSSLRIDHVSTKSSVLGVRRSQLLEKVGRLLDNAENFMQYV